MQATRGGVSLLLAIAVLALTSCGRTSEPTTTASSAPDVCTPLPDDVGTVSLALTIDQVETESMKRLGPGAAQVPFGYGENQWRALKARLQPGDTLHEYRGLSSGGYLVLRKHCLVDQLQTWAR